MRISAKEIYLLLLTATAHALAAARGARESDVIRRIHKDRGVKSV